MMMRVLIAVALLAGALTLVQRPASACCDVSIGFVSNTRSSGWIRLHRPDGEVVHVKIDHIVFVMSATNSGSDKRAQAKLQLVNGFCDVRESVDEVMQVIRTNEVIG
jgi:hypothetical protein